MTEPIAARPAIDWTSGLSLSAPTFRDWVMERWAEAPDQEAFDAEFLGGLITLPSDEPDAEPGDLSLWLVIPATPKDP